MSKNKIRPIAIHLPQFHPFPENDEWWGKGFTEWTNVAKSTPKFKGHYQPHLPSDLGFYDLRLEESMLAQEKLAKEYGIYGFCYYHYWFNGKLLMEQPLENMLNSKKISMPFCLCWANENWTRRWDGLDHSILIEQNYNLEDDLEHIQYLIRFFKDDRYIKINNKPVLVMYRSELHPDIKKATEIWREEVKKAGFDDIYLIRTENFIKNITPQDHGFDAEMEFAPNFQLSLKKYFKKKNYISYSIKKFLHNIGVKTNAIFTNKIVEYPDLVKEMMNLGPKPYKHFRTITPSWDNSARRQENATIYYNSTPEKFGEWTKFITELTDKNMEGDEKIFFINAWNEWAEGNHLEPDSRFGRGYLEEFYKNFSEAQMKE